MMMPRHLRFSRLVVPDVSLTLGILVIRIIQVISLNLLISCFHEDVHLFLEQL